MTISVDDNKKTQIITNDRVAEAEKTRNKYKSANSEHYEEIREAFTWYRLQQSMIGGKKTGIDPRSGWTFNVIANKHADAVDNKPSPNILPREDADREEAQLLSDIIPCILDHAGFDKVYKAVQWYKLVAGTAAYGVIWDSSLDNGIGDISITKIDVLNLIYEPGKSNIQDCANVFYVSAQNNDYLEEAYPQLKGKLSSPAFVVEQYTDDKIDMTEKSAVVDWYYKRRNSNGKTVVHFCRYCNGEVLYATENDEELRERGLYDDGRYPFVITTCYPLENDIAGFGFVHITKGEQEYTDRLRKAILENLLANTSPRYLVRADGNINEEEYADYTKPFVHYSGGQYANSIFPIEGKPLPSGVLDVLKQTIDQMKETSGTRDVNTGGATSGVTAASAIAALQEASGKLSRDLIDGEYNAFREIVLMVIERIRQFYSFERSFRILGEDGAYRFEKYTNAHLQPRPADQAFGVEINYRVPMFDVEISAEKQSPYKRVSQNELALQLYQLRVLDPANADQALALIDLMDFPRKEILLQKIAERGAVYAQQQAMLAAAGMQMMQSGGGQLGDGQPVSLAGQSAEPSNVRKARQQAAESVSPN